MLLVLSAFCSVIPVSAVAMEEGDLTAQVPPTAAPPQEPPVISNTYPQWVTGAPEETEESTSPTTVTVFSAGPPLDPYEPTFATTITDSPIQTPEPATAPEITAPPGEEMTTAIMSDTTVLSSTTGECEECDDGSCTACLAKSLRNGGGGNGGAFFIIAVISAGIAAASPFVIKEIKLNKLYRYD